MLNKSVPNNVNQQGSEGNNNQQEKENNDNLECPTVEETIAVQK